MSERIIKKRQDAITDALLNILNSRFDLYRTYIYLKPTFDQINRMAHEGKRIRGLLTLSGYYLGNGSNKDILKIAGAVELMHLAMLVYDDIIDHAEFRRSVKTIHNLAVNKRISSNAEGVAISMGILLEQMSISTMINTSFKKTWLLKAIESLTKTIEVVGCGEAMELFIDRLEDPKEQDILSILHSKSGLYTITMPLIIGAQLSGVNRYVKKILRKAGISMGVAFQIVDDLLGVFSDAESEGKPVKDILEKKETLLTYWTREGLTDADLKRFNMLYKSSKPMSEADIKWVKQIMIESGAIEKVKDILDEHYMRAINLLKQIQTSFKDINKKEIDVVLEIFKLIKEKSNNLVIK